MKRVGVCMNHRIPNLADGHTPTRPSSPAVSRQKMHQNPHHEKSCATGILSSQGLLASTDHILDIVYFVTYWQTSTGPCSDSKGSQSCDVPWRAFLEQAPVLSPARSTALDRLPRTCRRTSNPSPSRTRPHQASLSPEASSRTRSQSPG